MYLYEIVIATANYYLLTSNERFILSNRNSIFYVQSGMRYQQIMTDHTY